MLLNAEPAAAFLTRKSDLLRCERITWHVKEGPHWETLKILKKFAPARHAREEPHRETLKIVTNFAPARHAREEPHR